MYNVQVTCYRATLLYLCVDISLLWFKNQMNAALTCYRETASHVRSNLKEAQ